MERNNMREHRRSVEHAGYRHIRRRLGMILLCGIFLMLNPVCVQAKNIVAANHQKYDYEEYRKDLKQLEKKYCKHCKVNVIGETADKRNLYEVVLGNPEAQKHLVVIANLHAREYMTTLLCMKQIEYYLQNYLIRLLFILCHHVILMVLQSANMVLMLSVIRHSAGN